MPSMPRLRVRKQPDDHNREHNGECRRSRQEPPPLARSSLRRMPVDPQSSAPMSMPSRSMADCGSWSWRRRGQFSRLITQIVASKILVVHGLISCGEGVILLCVPALTKIIRSGPFVLKATDGSDRRRASRSDTRRSPSFCLAMAVNLGWQRANGARAPYQLGRPYLGAEPPPAGRLIGQSDVPARQPKRQPA